MKLEKLLKLAAAFILFAAPAYAQTPWVTGETTAVVGGDDKQVAALIQYIGTDADGEVAVSAVGDLTFISGADGAEVAVTQFECPVSGSLGGVIDVSDAACDTWGEVADVVNASADWRMILLDVTRDQSSNTAGKTLSSATAKKTCGLQIVTDTATIDYIGFALTNQRCIENYMNSSGTFFERPFQDLRAVLAWLRVYVDTTGAGVLTINAVDWHPGSETVTQLYNESITDATITVSALTGDELVGKKGQKLMIKLTNSAIVDGTSEISGYGFEYRYREP